MGLHELRTTGETKDDAWVRNAAGAARNGTPAPCRKMGLATGTTAAEKTVRARAAERGATAVADENGPADTQVEISAGSRDVTETRGAAEEELSTSDG